MKTKYALFSNNFAGFMQVKVMRLTFSSNTENITGIYHSTDGAEMKDMPATITCLPVLLMIINMQMNTGSKIRTQGLIITVEHRGYK